MVLIIPGGVWLTNPELSSIALDSVDSIPDPIGVCCSCKSGIQIRPAGSL